MSKPGTLLDAPAPQVETRVPSPSASTSTTRWHWLVLVFVVLAYARPLGRLAEFAYGSDLYSYILLIPMVSAYLGWQKRARPASPLYFDLRLGVPLILSGIALLAGYFFTSPIDAPLPLEDQLALTTSSFLLTTGGLAVCLLGRAFLRPWAFPLGLLVFMIPLPTDVMVALETLMQHGSAAVARLLFGLFGTPVFYQELNFQLPGVNLRVAPECSGLRSTLALTIVSVVTGYFFLRSPVKRTWLAAAVVPLALLRNGFRIFTVSELCVHLGPHMIESYIHRHGGPIFFALSLAPFFLLVFWLQKLERTRTTGR